MKKVNALLISLLFLSLLFMASSCTKDNADDIIVDPTQESDYSFGWNGEEDLNTIPSVTTFGTGNGNLPSSVNLVPKFPPIGNQGAFGTCVAWAAGYNLKTALNGMDHGLSTSQLTSPSNQFSPKDLFTAIPDNKKGPNCDGTNFTQALDVMQSRGIATAQTVPYNNLSDCSQSNLQSNWTSEANQNKIKYWRKVESNVMNIKEQLANNIPLVFGAKLADNFMTWNTDNVMSSNTTYHNVGQHAYHALIVAGYDDNKGPNGAFLVINSWGENWGDRGYIWVDYQFMVNEFCKDSNGNAPIFMAVNEKGQNNPPDNVDPTVSGVDLAPWVFDDYSTFDYTGIFNERIIEFDIYNIGNETASPNADWSFYYIYYNAYDANDYGVIFYDEFNTSVAAGTFQNITDNNAVFNFSIPSGGSFANTVWGFEGIGRYYYMPQITGEYYLVLIADAGEAFTEEDEANNLFYTTLEPKYFEEGYSLRPAGTGNSIADFKFSNKGKVTRDQLNGSSFNSVVTSEFRNAYTPEEILEKVKMDKSSGVIDQMVQKFIQDGKPKGYPK